MDKKAQIWISAVLYMALGVVVLTLVLAAGVPMIQKMKDKNVFAQTKSVFYALDENIKAVASEGPGAKRFLSPFEVKAGELSIDAEGDRILWKLRTKAKLMEPSYDFRGQATSVPEFREGSIYMFMSETNVVDEYFANLKLDYRGTADISLQTQFQGALQGVYSLSIRHSGEFVNNLPVVILEVTA